MHCVHIHNIVDIALAMLLPATARVSVPGDSEWSYGQEHARAADDPLQEGEQQRVDVVCQGKMGREWAGVCYCTTSVRPCGGGGWYHFSLSEIN